MDERPWPDLHHRVFKRRSRISVHRYRSEGEADKRGCWMRAIWKAVVWFCLLSHSFPNCPSFTLFIVSDSMENWQTGSLDWEIQGKVEGKRDMTKKKKTHGHQGYTCQPWDFLLKYLCLFTAYSQDCILGMALESFQWNVYSQRHWCRDNMFDQIPYCQSQEQGPITSTGLLLNFQALQSLNTIKTRISKHFSKTSDVKGKGSKQTEKENNLEEKNCEKWWIKYHNQREVLNLKLKYMELAIQKWQIISIITSNFNIY